MKYEIKTIARILVTIEDAIPIKRALFLWLSGRGLMIDAIASALSEERMHSRKITSNTLGMSSVENVCCINIKKTSIDQGSI